ncbi:MAG: class I SAM-dependent methyltransferase [Acidobacteria bacterium]|nr:class I SAM-dependent methyltransferase [Acidobacteriota bacterium]MCL5287448.1 class I SAM-dependent methyltransferase [Acidobacteriota bacterium]
MAAASKPGTTDQKPAIRRYWDAHPISTDSVEFEPGTAESFEAIYAKWKATIDERRLRFLAECRGKKVLEIGCGIGKDARFLTENGIDYTGLDYSWRAVELAQKHFDLAQLRKRFVNGDARALPFQDSRFDLVMSIGVLHHLPETVEACREVMRVVRPGGSVRIMLYNRHSYHYALVTGVVRPLIWLMLAFPPARKLLSVGPPKLGHMFAICQKHGFTKGRLLAISADTSFEGEGNFVVHTTFHTEKEMRKLFEGLEDFHFFRSNVKYFFLPFLRNYVEKRWGLFLTMTARKPERAVPA